MQTINTNNLNEARTKIQKLLKENPKEKIAILSQDDEFNRKCLEIKGLNMLVINENFPQKDYMRQRSSGLNEVLTKMCMDKNISIGIQIKEIIIQEDVEKAKSLARLKQNIMLCKKVSCNLFFLDDKKFDKRNLQAILLVLGASTSQAKEAVKQDF